MPPCRETFEGTPLSKIIRAFVFHLPRLDHKGNHLIVKMADSSTEPANARQGRH